MTTQGSRVRSIDFRSVTLPQGPVPWHLLRQDPESVFLPSLPWHGFVGCSKQTRPILAEAAASFISGYSDAIDTASIGELHDRLGDVPVGRRGFAHESAGGRRVTALLLEGPGASYTHLIHVGTAQGFAPQERLVCQQTSHTARSRGPTRQASTGATLQASAPCRTTCLPVTRATKPPSWLTYQPSSR